jgi:tryptophan-rich sensory protein
VQELSAIRRNGELHRVLQGTIPAVFRQDAQVSTSGEFCCIFKHAKLMSSSLLLSILLFYVILIGVNIPAPFLGLDFESGEKPVLWYQPPGFVIPIVWFVLFTLLGIARHHLIQTGNMNLQGLLIVLAVLCASYAYYTLGFAKLTHISALWFGFWGNVAVIAAAVFVVVRLYPVSATAAWLTLPVIVWTCYATLIVLGEMRLQKLI